MKLRVHLSLYATGVVSALALGAILLAAHHDFFRPSLAAIGLMAACWLFVNQIKTADLRALLYSGGLVIGAIVAGTVGWSGLVAYSVVAYFAGWLLAAHVDSADPANVSRHE